jgi:hypothetical protein
MLHVFLITHSKQQVLTKLGTMSNTFLLCIFIEMKTCTYILLLR